MGLDEAAFNHDDAVFVAFAADPDNVEFAVLGDIFAL